MLTERGEETVGLENKIAPATPLALEESSLVARVVSPEIDGPTMPSTRPGRWTTHVRVLGTYQALKG